MSARDLSPEQRRERGTNLCRRLAEDVALIAPQGIGSWDRAWDIVGPADAAFMAALSGWEADPSPGTLERTRAAYQAVLQAWRVATAAWERQEAQR